MRLVSPGRTLRQAGPQEVSIQILYRGVHVSVAKVTEITAQSSKSFDDAMQLGISRAAQTIRGIQGAWLKEQQLIVNDGKVEGYRVTMKLTFVLS